MQEPYPHLQPIYGGKWAAHGDGWAVHGETKEEATAKYWQAVKRHQELLQMPPWFVQKAQQETKGE